MSRFPNIAGLATRVYHHQINRGGLESILRTNRLRASDAATIAGGTAAVRAHTGRYLESQPGGFAQPPVEEGFRRTNLYVEFQTNHQPDPVGNPSAPAFVRWLMDAGEYLQVQVTGLFTSAGESVHVTDGNGQLDVEATIEAVKEIGASDKL